MFPSTFKAGEKIGIIGRVGSGKTTVGRLLRPAFYPAEAIGSILVDGIGAPAVIDDPAHLRAGIGFVLQDTDLFYGKLRDNITLVHGRVRPTRKCCAGGAPVRRRNLYRGPSAGL